MDYHQSTKIIFLPGIYHVFPLYNKEIRKFHLITSSQVIAAALPSTFLTIWITILKCYMVKPLEINLTNRIQWANINMCILQI